MAGAPTENTGMYSREAQRRQRGRAGIEIKFKSCNVKT
jgi:hypothetical protein